jgi:glycosyltransferase involved in cell wall biosynthesis
MSQLYGGEDMEPNQSTVGDFLHPYCGILCFGGEDWWYHNQAHFDMQIMRCMARRVPVLYVNSLGFGMPRLAEGAHFLKKVGRKVRSVTHITHSPFPGFHVTSPFSVPLWNWPLIAKLNSLSLRTQIATVVRSVGLRKPIIWVACPTSYEIIRGMQRESFLVYQRTDKYEEYSDHSKEYIQAAHRWLSTRADLVIYASTALYEEERELNSKRLLVRHGVELTLFDRDKALMAECPPDLENIKRPIVGFFGDIEGNLVDMELIAACVRAFPEVSFVFVGRLIASVSLFRELPNAYFLGKKPYEAVPQYGARFDVAIMPWNQNRWIQYCNPIKLKEYLALGLPIVTTEFPEALHYTDVMYVARGHDEFMKGIREALTDRPVGTVATRRARVANDTWEQATLRITNIIRKRAGQNLAKRAAADPRISPSVESFDR